MNTTLILDLKMNHNNVSETIYLSNRQQWRQWLQENHGNKQSVWLIFYKKKADVPTMTWGDAVDEALCFGWIDSKRQSIDEEKFRQYFSKRKAKSTWSKVNKAKVEELTEAGFMTKAGFECIKIAKDNGWWSILDEVEELIIPDDLEQEFQKTSGSKRYFLSLSDSDKKRILQWVALARQKQTRLKRIREIVETAAQNQKPSQLR